MVPEKAQADNSGLFLRFWEGRGDKGNEGHTEIIGISLPINFPQIVLSVVSICTSGCVTDHVGKSEAGIPGNSTHRSTVVIVIVFFFLFQKIVSLKKAKWMVSSGGAATTVLLLHYIDSLSFERVYSLKKHYT